MRLTIAAKKPRTTRLVGGDATALQIEQLLVIETASRRCMPGTDDLAGLDLEVRHGVSPRTLGEDQVAVQLVGLGALRGRTEDHVTDPHRVRRVALEGTLVLDVGDAVRRLVVDEETVFLMLPRVREVHADRLERATWAVVAHVGAHPHD